MSHASGYKQTRPFSIYVFGPDNDLSDMVYANTLEALKDPGNPYHDHVEPDRDASVCAMGNSFTAHYRPRRRGDDTMKFTLTADPAPLDPRSDSFGTMPRIDAAVLVFRAEDPKHFIAVRDIHMPRLVSIAGRQKGENMIIHLLAGKRHLFHIEQGYDALELARLVRWSHALFMHGVYSQLVPCRDVLESVMRHVITEHTRYQLARRDEAERAAAPIAERSMWTRLFSLHRQCFPVCEPTYRADDAPAMTEEDRRFHAPQGHTSDRTPMGIAVHWK